MIRKSDFSFKRQYYDFLLLIILSLFLISKYSGEFVPVPIIPLLIVFVALSLFQKSIFSFPVIKKIRWENVIWFSFLLLILVSYFWTRSTIYGYRKMYLLFPMLLIPGLWGFFLVKSFKQFRIVYLIMHASAILYLVLFKSRDIIQSYAAGYVGRLSLQGEDTENSGVLALGTFFAFGILIGLSHVKISFPKTFVSFLKIHAFNFFLLAVILGSATFMFLTGSRGPMLALFISLFLFYFIKHITFFRAIVSFSIAGFLYLLFQATDVISYIIGKSPRGVQLMFERRFTETASNESLLNRFEHYQNTIDAIANASLFHQIFGFGIGDWGYFLWGNPSGRAYPHNFFIEIWYELGLVGLILFSLCLLKVILINIKLRKSNIKELDWIIIAFYFYLLRAQSSGDLPSNFVVFVFFLLAIKGAQYYKPQLIKKNLPIPR